MAYKESVIAKLAEIQDRVLKMYEDALRAAFPAKFTTLPEFCRMQVHSGEIDTWINEECFSELDASEMFTLSEVFTRCARRCPTGSLLTAYTNNNSHNYDIGKLIMKTDVSESSRDFRGYREQGEMGNICRADVVVPVCVRLPEAYERIAIRLSPRYARTYLGITDVPTLNEQF